MEGVAVGSSVGEAEGEGWGVELTVGSGVWEAVGDAVDGGLGVTILTTSICLVSVAKQPLPSVTSTETVMMPSLAGAVKDVELEVGSLKIPDVLDQLYCQSKPVLFNTKKTVSPGSMEVTSFIFIIKLQSV